MRTILCIFAALAVLNLNSCANKKNNDQTNDDKVADSLQPLKKFYFPFDELSEGLVYEYVDDSTGFTVDYWLYKTVKDEAGDRFLIATGYDAFFEQRYFSREWIVANGTILKDYLFMQPDSVTKKSVVRPAKIEENVIFPFNPVKDTSLAYRFRIKFSLLPDTAMNYDLVRNRKFDQYLDYEFEGKKLPAVQFSADEFIEAKDTIKEGGHWNINSKMIEIYAEGIGLVFKEKRGAGANFKNRLKRRMTPTEFEKLQGAKE
jgi:hypothetical protein